MSELIPFPPSFLSVAYEINEVFSSTLNEIDINALIAEYEESEITDISKLLEVEIFLNIKKENFSDETKLVVDKIILLIKKAIKNNVGIYFFF